MAKKKKTIKVSKPKTIPGVIKAITIIDYVLGIITIVAAAMFLIGGTMFGILGPLDSLMPNMLTRLVGGGIFTFAAVIMAVIGILYLYLAKAIKEYKLWAKIVQLILAILSIFSFPIGTAIGIFIIWALLINEETRDLFK